MVKEAILYYVIIAIIGFAGYSLYTGKESISNITNSDNQLVVELKQEDSNTINTTANNRSNESSVSEKKSSFTPNINNIKLIMSLKKDEVLELLGSEYTIYEGEYEWQDKGYCYERYGMTIYFDKYLEPEMIGYIECNNKVDINGATVGMTFKEISKILGKKEPIVLEQYEPTQPKYAICYVIDNFKVWFGAGEDGITTDLQLRHNYDVD